MLSSGGVAAGNTQPLRRSGEVMDPVERAAWRLDAAQQRSAPIAFVAGDFMKYADAIGGISGLRGAALITILQRAKGRRPIPAQISATDSGDLQGAMELPASVFRPVAGVWPQEGKQAVQE